MPKSIQPSLIALIVGLCVLAIFSTIRYEHFAAKRHYGDFHVYYVTGERVLAGQPIYVDETETVTPYKYSPLIASLFSLLAFFGEKNAANIWHLLNLIFLFSGAVIGSRLAQRNSHINDKRSLFLVISFGIFGVSPALVHCLNSGQVGIAILFCYVLGVYLAVSGKEIASGFFFAFSCMFKYLPILILPYFIFQKKWKLFWAMSAAFLIFHLMPALWFGWSKNTEYLFQFLPFLTGTTLDHISLLDFKNQSMWAYLYRLIFYDMGFFEIRNHPRLILAIGTALFAVLYWLVLSRTRQSSLTLGCALLSILIVLFNPNAWKHNFVLLLLPYQVLLGESVKQGWKSRSSTVLITVSVLFFVSNRSIVGWGGRFELLSMSILLLAGLILFSGLVLSKFPQDRPTKAV